MKINNWLENHDFVINSEIRKYFLELICTHDKDNIEFINNNLDDIIYVIYKFSNDPLVKQKTILHNLNCTQKNLLKINSIIRNIKEIQNIILKKGSGERYWNSILPFAKYASKVINSEYSFPLRIAFFPGVSCMYYCGFCGRNQDAKYPSDTAKVGIEKLKSVIDEIHDNTAISISGGLEPLTNPYLGELITHAKNKNLKVPLITNAYSMTDSYLNKNQGIWDTDSLRVSVYGVDDETYNFVTRSPKSYKMVRKNSINFLNKKNEKKSNVKFGFNYIVLKENIKDLKKLCLFIDQINQESKSEINFLTLREDFGSVTGHDQNLDTIRKYRLEGFLNSDDRKFLRDELLSLEEFKKKNFPNMHIDYGYALRGLLDNKLDYYLIRANNEEVTLKGYPQLSVAIDLFGDVFLYREAGFLDRDGNKDFIIGRIGEKQSLAKIITNHLKIEKKATIKNSTRFLDSFDHMITKLVSQATSDKELGIPFEHGPIKLRSEKVKINLGNNWYS